MVKVSICIPVYKQMEYLKKCLDSVFMQDYKQFELIITDDTPDNSVEQFLINTLKDKQYRYFRNKHALGSPENWNYAMSLAQGKYIKILHHDDFFTFPNSLSLMVQQMENDKSSFLFSQTMVWYPKLNSSRIHSITSVYLKKLKFSPDFLFFKNVIGSPSATMHLRQSSLCFDSRLKWLVDVDFYIQVLFHSRNFSFIDKPLVTTAHDIEGQVTNAVQNDRMIQLREHVIVFNKWKNEATRMSQYESFFDNLFYKYDVTDFEDLLTIVPEAAESELFYRKIIAAIPERRWWKNLCNSFYAGKYNRYIFKLEQYA